MNVVYSLFSFKNKSAVAVASTIDDHVSVKLASDAILRAVECDDQQQIKDLLASGQYDVDRTDVSQLSSHEVVC